MKFSSRYCWYVSAWNEPELLNSSLKCNFCDQLKLDMTLFQLRVILISVVLFISMPNIITIMSVTFSLSFPNVELIRVNMF